MARDAGSLVKDKNFIFKVVEMVICVVSTAIMTDKKSAAYFTEIMATHTAIVAILGYLIICLCILTTIILDEDSKGRLPVILIAIGAVLNIATGILFIMRYDDLKSFDNTEHLAAIGSLQLICGLVMAVDVFFMFKK